MKYWLFLLLLSAVLIGCSDPPGIDGPDAGDQEVTPDIPEEEPRALQEAITFATAMGELRSDDIRLIVLVGGPEPIGRLEGNANVIELGPGAVLNQ